MKTIDGKARTIREILSQDLLFLFKAPIRDLCGLGRSPAHEPCRRPRMAIEWLGNAPYSRLACRHRLARPRGQEASLSRGTALGVLVKLPA